MVESDRSGQGHLQATRVTAFVRWDPDISLLTYPPPEILLLTSPSSQTISLSFLHVVGHLRLPPTPPAESAHLQYTAIYR